MLSYSIKKNINKKLTRFEYFKDLSDYLNIFYLQQIVNINIDLDNVWEGLLFYDKKINCIGYGNYWT